jgi:uncharacterized membrane protein
VDDLAIFRALHVAGVVLWIGGVAFVTTVLLPAIRNLKSPEERVAFFESIENKFAGQARVTTLLVGLTGFYIIYQWNLWERFLDLNFWWLHAMLAIWLLFTMMLFIAEPLFLHRWFLENAKHKPEATFQRIEWLHRGLLTVSLITLIGAVVGSHSLH